MKKMSFTKKSEVKCQKSTFQKTNCKKLTTAVLFHSKKWEKGERLCFTLVKVTGKSF